MLQALSFIFFFYAPYLLSVLHPATPSHESLVGWLYLNRPARRNMFLPVGLRGLQSYERRLPSSPAEASYMVGWKQERSERQNKSENMAVANFCRLTRLFRCFFQCPSTSAESIFRSLLAYQGTLGNHRSNPTES